MSQRYAEAVGARAADILQDHAGHDRAPSSAALWTKALGSYVSFHGRIGRAEYHMKGLFWAALSLLIYLAHLSPLSGGLLASAAHQASAGPSLLQTLVYSLAGGVIALVRLSLEVRRFHDRGKSGLWCLALLVPGLNAYLLFANSSFASEPGANQYGP